MAVTPSTKRTTKLLKPNEVSACKKLAASDKADKQRAVALLAIHQGETQLQAASTSGLTIGQVKYIVTRFRRLGMAALSVDEQQTTTSTDTPVKPAKAKAEKVKKKKKEAKKTKKDKDDKKKNKDKKNKDKKSKKDKKKKAKKNK